MYFAVNRRSVTSAFAIGVCISMLPVPGHMAIAVLVSLLLGVNLAVAAAATWLNSPFTLIPTFYFEYRLGTFLLRVPPQERPATVSWNWLLAQPAHLWRPLLLGAAIVASATGILVYFAANALWRWSAARRLRARRKARAGR